MSGHTPGPWTWNEDDGSLEAPDPVLPDDEDATYEVLGIMHYGDWPSDADRALIAAAPTMLAALEAIARGEGPFSTDQLTHATNTIEAMQAIAVAAIAKARGES